MFHMEVVDAFNLGGVSGGRPVRLGDVGHVTAHWEGFEQVPPHGGPRADGITTLERSRQCMGVSPASRSND